MPPGRQALLAAWGWYQLPGSAQSWLQAGRPGAARTWGSALDKYQTDLSLHILPAPLMNWKGCVMQAASLMTGKILMNQILGLPV